MITNVGATPEACTSRPLFLCVDNSATCYQHGYNRAGGGDQLISIGIPRLRGIYYGWVLLLTLSFTEITSWGILYYSFSVFLTPMHTELGWSIAQMTGAYSLAILVSGLAAIPVGRWLDRHGPRWLMTAGSVAAMLLVLAWSRVESIVVFYVVWACIGVTLSAVLYEPALQSVAVWFRRKRSRALTILTFFGGFASVIYIPLVDEKSVLLIKSVSLNLVLKGTDSHQPPVLI
jgi:MFS family permease